MSICQSYLLLGQMFINFEYDTKYFTNLAKYIDLHLTGKKEI